MFTSLHPRKFKTCGFLCPPSYKPFYISCETILTRCYGFRLQQLIPFQLVTKAFDFTVWFITNFTTPSPLVPNIGHIFTLAKLFFYDPIQNFLLLCDNVFQQWDVFVLNLTLKGRTVNISTSFFNHQSLCILYS
jgi:hypothetical protein